MGRGLSDVTDGYNRRILAIHRRMAGEGARLRGLNVAD
jgi:hypothetical protein